MKIFFSQGSVETCLGSVGNFNSSLVPNFVPIKMLKKKFENRPIFDKVMTLDKRVSNLLGHSVDDSGYSQESIVNADAILPVTIIISGLNQYTMPLTASSLKSVRLCPL